MGKTIKLTNAVQVEIGREVVVKDIQSNRMVRGTVRAAYIAGHHGDDINGHLWAEVEAEGRIYRVRAWAVLPDSQAHCYCSSLPGLCDFCTGTRRPADPQTMRTEESLCLPR